MGTETFGFLGLSNLVTSETQTPTSGSATTKTYAYDAWGQRTTMTSKVGSGTTNWYAYGADVHGSVSTLLNITSTNQPSATASYGYSAYGGADDDLTAGDYDPSDPIGTGEINNNNPLNAYRYTGKRLDTGAADGLDMGARRYSPDAARFLQLDYFNGALSDLALSSDPLTANRYALAGGNPLSFIEWDGHMAILEGGGGGASSPTPPPTPPPSSTPEPPPIHGCVRCPMVPPTYEPVDVDWSGLIAAANSGWKCAFATWTALEESATILTSAAGFASTVAGDPLGIGIGITAWGIAQYNRDYTVQSVQYCFGGDVPSAPSIIIPEIP